MSICFTIEYIYSALYFVKLLQFLLFKIEKNCFSSIIEDKLQYRKKEHH